MVTKKMGGLGESPPGEGVAEDTTKRNEVKRLVAGARGRLSPPWKKAIKRGTDLAYKIKICELENFIL